MLNGKFRMIGILLIACGALLAVMGSGSAAAQDDATPVGEGTPVTEATPISTLPTTGTGAEGADSSMILLVGGLGLITLVAGYAVLQTRREQ